MQNISLDIVRWCLNISIKQEIFVRNKVEKILKEFGDEEILYAKTQDNPADVGTRPKKLEAQLESWKEGCLFHNGPAFLQDGVEKALE